MRVETRRLSSYGSQLRSTFTAPPGAKDGVANWQALSSAKMFEHAVAAQVECESNFLKPGYLICRFKG
jgi:hypothetical protein